ncbi:MICOS complex subunit MIC13 [Nerophis lumbriciformis]|uniref:MICOS complex subunit MIC13 n=1 Tax=Nerophis lumbriciformis TaxID=546530 RepID=UPI002AE0914D|nr:MICOS complex subunit MIC13-like [Nerophis lumbriciformis]XP_061894906.1 MICOS complex subunit MIC13 [Entelurus aequoreus]
MAAKVLPVIKLATKVTIAGGALYVAYDSGLLGSSEQGSEALGRAASAIPPAVEEWMKYFGLEAQLPTIPKVEFSPVQTWNSGVRRSISALSDGPRKAADYSSQGLQYVKDLTK